MYSRYRKLKNEFLIFELFLWILFNKGTRGSTGLQLGCDDNGNIQAWLNSHLECKLYAVCLQQLWCKYIQTKSSYRNAVRSCYELLTLYHKEVNEISSSDMTCFGLVAKLPSSLNSSLNEEFSPLGEMGVRLVPG